jgi:hypothetical protein
LKALWLRVRQRWCSHSCYIEDIRRVDPERVECPCHRCGKVLSAAYGLVLPAQLHQRPRP